MNAIGTRQPIAMTKQRTVLRGAKVVPRTGSPDLSGRACGTEGGAASPIPFSILSDGSPSLCYDHQKLIKDEIIKRGMFGLCQ
jgi:hypothetical protein